MTAQYWLVPGKKRRPQWTFNLNFYLLVPIGFCWFLLISVGSHFRILLVVPWIVFLTGAHVPMLNPLWPYNVFDPHPRLCTALLAVRERTYLRDSRNHTKSDSIRSFIWRCQCRNVAWWHRWYNERQVMGLSIMEFKNMVCMVCTASKWHQNWS